MLVVIILRKDTTFFILQLKITVEIMLKHVSEMLCLFLQYYCNISAAIQTF